MFGQYLISFREVLEAALITTIILAYLTRTGKSNYSRYIWYGIIIAVAASTVFGIGIWAFFGGLSEANTKLFEGTAAIIAVVVLTSMIIWMAFKGRYLKTELQEKVDTVIQTGTVLSLVGFAFVVVFREGFETVLFLTPFGAADSYGTIIGALLGIVSALVIAYIIFRIGKNISLKNFFYFSSLLLIFLAAGLLGYGVHELIEYREVVGSEGGWLTTYAYDLGIAKDSLFYHKGALGSIFAVMFGYSVKMEWARVIAHLLYLFIFIPLTVIAYKKPEKFGFIITKWEKIKSIIVDRRKVSVKKDDINLHQFEK